MVTNTLFLSGCMQLLQDTLGSAVLLRSGIIELTGGGFRPSRQDVFEFINQCGDITSTEPDKVSHLKAHTTYAAQFDDKVILLDME